MSGRFWRTPIFHDIPVPSEPEQLDSALEVLAQRTESVLEAESVLLYLWDAEAGLLRLAATAPMRSDTETLCPEEQIATQAFSRRTAVTEESNALWSLAVPMLRGADPVGAVVLRLPNGGKAEEAAAVAQFVAAQAATMITMAEALRLKRQAQAESERNAGALSGFVSVVSHEFSTVLTTILGFSEMLRDEDLDRSEVREFAAEIHQAAQRLEGLVEETLDMDAATLDSGALKLEPVEITDLFRSIVESLNSGSPHHMIILELRESYTNLGASYPNLTVDRARFRLAISKMVAAAAKYATSNSAIALRCAVERETCHVEVQYEGVSPPDEESSGLFQGYSRRGPGQRRFIQGLGLELPIARGIAELHGGRLWVESGQGSGGSFHVMLPLAGPTGRAQ